jgi:hypothetical protein
MTQLKNDLNYIILLCNEIKMKQHGCNLVYKVADSPVIETIVLVDEIIELCSRPLDYLKIIELQIIKLETELRRSKRHYELLRTEWNEYYGRYGDIDQYSNSNIDEDDINDE